MMTRTKRALASLAVVALALSLPACKKLNGDEDEGGLPTSEELSIAISQTFFEFEHVVGESPCPQLVGRLIIRNMGTSPFTTDVKARGTVPLAFSPNVTVQPGGSATIDIFFTCASQQNFIVTVDTLRENERQQSSDSLPPGSFNVQGSIKQR